MGHFGYLEAGVIGLTQGVTELFPVSSLGHSVLLPALIGGSWARDLNVSASESPYLAFVVALHVATAIALIVYFRRDWAGCLSSRRSQLGSPGSPSSTRFGPCSASPFPPPPSCSSTG